METEHTPGPWAVHLSEETNQFEVFHDEGRGYGRMLAQIVGERGRFKANAQLIAAAPDLLDALEQAVQLLDNIDGRVLNNGVILSYNQDIPGFRAAIAKARGNS